MFQLRLPMAAALALSLLVATVTPTALAAPRARSESRKERAARTHFNKAEQAFNLGKFQEALTGYEAAYQAMALPAFLFNIAQCHRNLGDAERALFFYQRYLNLETNPPNRRAVEELIAEQNRRLARGRREREEPVAPPRAPAAAPADTETVTSPLMMPERDREASPVGSHLTTPPDAAVHGAPTERPLYRKPWFWGAVGAAVLGGVALAFAASGGSSLPMGTLGHVDRRSAGIP